MQLTDYKKQDCSPPFCWSPFSPLFPPPPPLLRLTHALYFRGELCSQQQKQLTAHCGWSWLCSCRSLCAIRPDDTCLQLLHVCARLPKWTNERNNYCRWEQYLWSPFASSFLRPPCVHPPPLVCTALLSIRGEPQPLHHCCWQRIPAVITRSL